MRSILLFNTADKFKLIFMLGLSLGAGCANENPSQGPTLYDRVISAGTALRGAETYQDWNESPSNPDKVFANYRSPEAASLICEALLELSDEDLMIFVDQIEDPEIAAHLDCSAELILRLSNYIRSKKAVLDEIVSPVAPDDANHQDGAPVDDVPPNEKPDERPDQRTDETNYVDVTEEPGLDELFPENQPVQMVPNPMLKPFEPVLVPESVGEIGYSSQSRTRNGLEPLQPAEKSSPSVEPLVPVWKGAFSDYGMTPLNSYDIHHEIRTIDVRDVKTLVRGDLPNDYVAFTFDDGPHEKRTGEILGVLEQANVKATFFPTGHSASLYPDIVRKVLAAGHPVGSHSWDHENLNDISEKLAKESILKGHHQIENILGGPSYYFRFPYGEQNPRLTDFVKSEEMINVRWNMDPTDWKYTDPEYVFYLAIQEFEEKQRGIFVMHDTKAQTAIMLPYLLKELQYRGVRTVNFDAHRSNARSRLWGGGLPPR